MKGRESKTDRTLLDVIVLIVIAVIAVSLFFPDCSTDRRSSARRDDASTIVRNIVNALKSYHNDYGHFPEIGKPRADGKFVVYVGDPACKISESANSVIFDALRAIPRGANADHTLNPKRQKYFEGPRAKDPKHPHSGFADGAEFPARDQGCLFDPWGAQYCIVFTTDGSDKLDVSAVYSDFTEPFPFPAGAFSLGEDGIVGSKKYPGRYRQPSSSSPPDDILSWQ